jgi:uridine kinase
MLVEGLWLLHNPRIRKLCGFRIFLDAPMPLRLRRRLARDVTDRDRSRGSVQDQFRKAVEPMHRKFVLPQIRWCNVVLKGERTDRQITELTTLLRQRMA